MMSFQAVHISTISTFSTNYESIGEEIENLPNEFETRARLKYFNMRLHCIIRTEQCGSHSLQFCLYSFELHIILVRFEATCGTNFGRKEVVFS